VNCGISPAMASKRSFASSACRSSYQKWSPLGLTKTFNYNGTDNVVVEIRYRGATGGFNCFRCATIERGYTTGSGAYTSTQASSTGSMAAAKMQFKTQDIQLVLSGSPNPGGTVTLDMFAPTDANLPYQLGSSLGTGPIPSGSRQLDLCFGSPTWSYRLAQQIVRLMETGGEGIYHATSEGYATWFDLASEFLERMKAPHCLVPCTTADYPTAATRPMNSILENRRLKNAGINLMQDWPAWIKGGYADWVIPQLYRYDLAAYRRALDQLHPDSLSLSSMQRVYPGRRVRPELQEIKVPPVVPEQPVMPGRRGQQAVPDPQEPRALPVMPGRRGQQVLPGQRVHKVHQVQPVSPDRRGQPVPQAQPVLTDRQDLPEAQELQEQTDRQDQPGQPEKTGHPAQQAQPVSVVQQVKICLTKQII